MRYEKEMKQPVTKWLQERGLEAGYELMITGYADVIGFKFAERIGKPVPKLECVIVIELKLRDIKGVFRQARTNKYRVGSSWVAMPEDFCEHISPDWLDRFREEGIGLLAVGDSVSIVFPPFGGNSDGEAFGNWLHKKLWRVHRMNEKRKINETVNS